ncbi:MAG: hypothetical protein JJU27_01170 [Gammaproteobacteria bacterium]|nr:hypothetical protein [Gammaproteobacteria bacterium]
MKISSCCRAFARPLLPLVAVAVLGAQLLGAHMHLHGDHHDHAGAHVHSVHSPCHADPDHLGDGVEISLWHALLCKLPDVQSVGAAVALLVAPATVWLDVTAALQHVPERRRLLAHFSPLLRAPPR